MHSHRLKHIVDSGPNYEKNFLTILELFGQFLVLFEFPGDPFLHWNVSLEVFNDFLDGVSGVEHPEQEAR